MKFSIKSGENHKIDLVKSENRTVSVTPNGANEFNSDSSGSDFRSNAIIKRFNYNSTHVGDSNHKSHEFTMHIKVEKVNELTADNDKSKTPKLKSNVIDPYVAPLYSYISSYAKNLVKIKEIDLNHYNSMVTTYVNGDVAVNIGGGDSQISLTAPTIVNDDGTVQFGSVIIEAEMQKYHDCLIQLPASMVDALTFVEVIDLPEPLIFDITTYTLRGYVNFGTIKNIKFKFDNELVISCTIKPVMKSNARNPKGQ